MDFCSSDAFEIRGDWIAWSVWLVALSVAGVRCDELTDEASPSNVISSAYKNNLFIYVCDDPNVAITSNVMYGYIEVLMGVQQNN